MRKMPTPPPSRSTPRSSLPTCKKPLAKLAPRAPWPKRCKRSPTPSTPSPSSCALPKAPPTKRPPPTSSAPPSRMAAIPASRPCNGPALPPASPRASSARRGSTPCRSPLNWPPWRSSCARSPMSQPTAATPRPRRWPTARTSASVKSCWCMATSKSGIPPPTPRPPSGPPPKPWPCAPRLTKRLAGIKPSPTSPSLA